jgi:hypothetical protein
MYFVWIWEQTAFISLYNINWLVFISETECVYCAVRPESLYTILRSAHTVYLCFVSIGEQTAIISPYSITWLVCITETECVYCAVRAESLWKQKLVFFFKGLLRLFGWLQRTITVEISDNNTANSALSTAVETEALTLLTQSGSNTYSVTSLISIFMIVLFWHDFIS